MVGVTTQIVYDDPGPGPAVQVIGTPNEEVYRNTITGNNCVGLSFDAASTGGQVVGNILAFNTGAQFSMANGAEVGALVAYNCFWATLATDTLAVFKGVTYTRAQSALFFAALAAENPLSIGNICIDPLFMNAGSHDYRLQNGSHCLGAGISIVGVPVDFAGTPIPEGSHADMGAYERAHDVADAVLRASSSKSSSRNTRSRTGGRGR